MGSLPLLGTGLSGILPVSGDEIMDLQVFTESGTWTKPDGVSMVYVLLIGGGSGGDGGAYSRDEAYYGIGGAAAEFASAILIPALSLSAEVSVTVGAGGAYNAAGEAGEDSVFGNYLYSRIALYEGNYGGGGGNGGAESSAGDAGNPFYTGDGVEIAGGAGGAAGANGSAGTTLTDWLGGGGGGGGGESGGVAGNGGVGGRCAGGGGGGQGSNNWGAGGDGGDGLVIIASW